MTDEQVQEKKDDFYVSLRLDFVPLVNLVLPFRRKGVIKTIPIWNRKIFYLKVKIFKI